MEVLESLEYKAWAYVDLDPTPTENAFVTGYQRIIQIIPETWV